MFTFIEVKAMAEPTPEELSTFSTLGGIIEWVELDDDWGAVLLKSIGLASSQHWRTIVQISDEDWANNMM